MREGSGTRVATIYDQKCPLLTKKSMKHAKEPGKCDSYRGTQTT